MFKEDVFYHQGLSLVCLFYPESHGVFLQHPYGKGTRGGVVLDDESLIIERIEMLAYFKIRNCY